MDYDYREEVKNDVLQYLEDLDPICSCLAYSNRSKVEELLNDELWTDDSVTGNASGSYYCNAYKAEEALAHNWDLLADAIDEFGGSTDVLRDGPESCDVTIRCYVLGEAISNALDEFESEHPEKCGWCDEYEGETFDEDEEEE